ncbi:MAG: DUF2750 domain-containing protein [Pseudoalteromonas sp.]|uniref:DUF2750 domain-containing protein n=2 Tax=Pseudoalteromonas TaxID=53246 RepID=UPI003F9A25FB
MPYKMNEHQFSAVLSLSAEKRSRHFIERVADWEQLWGVKNDDGFFFCINAEGMKSVPVWPHPDYADVFTNSIENYAVCELSLHEFIDYWLPLFKNESINIAVFPNQQWVFDEIEPDVLSELLNQETSQYV